MYQSSLAFRYLLTLSQPNNVELLPGGLRAIPEALERFNSGKVDGVKMVVRPQET
jgi:hypothetical protein